LDRNLEGSSDCVAALIEHLVRGMKDEVVAVPCGQRGVGLHHGLALQRRGVSDVELYRSRGESAGEITHGAIRRSKTLRGARLTETVAQSESSGRAVIVHAHEVGGRSGFPGSLG